MVVYTLNYNEGF